MAIRSGDPSYFVGAAPKPLIVGSDIVRSIGVVWLHRYYTMTHAKSPVLNTPPYYPYPPKLSQTDRVNFGRGS